MRYPIGVMGFVLMVSGGMSGILLYSFPARAAETKRIALDPIAEKLRAAVLDAQKKIGEGEPWQKAIFTEEVVPQFQRFIRDYGELDKGFRVAVDYDTLKNYLSFYGPNYLKQNNPKVLVLLKGDLSCPKCIESAPAIKVLVRARLERRGFTPVWANADEIGRENPDHVIESRLVEMAKLKGIPAVVYIQWSALNDAEAIAEQEKRYLIRSFLKVGEISMSARQKELLDTDSFESSEARLLTDIFTDLGAKLKIEQASAVEAGKQEVLVDVSGFQSFTQYTQVKSFLQNGLNNVATVEDREFSKGRVVFAIFSNLPVDQLKAQIKQLGLSTANGVNLTVVVR